MRSNDHQGRLLHSRYLLEPSSPGASRSSQGSALRHAALSSAAIDRAASADDVRRNLFLAVDVDSEVQQLLNPFIRKAVEEFHFELPKLRPCNDKAAVFQKTSFALRVGTLVIIPKDHHAIPQPLERLRARQELGDSSGVDQRDPARPNRL